ncbi:hypothetical protein V8C86DRAFT_2964323, partial [Haematococcus lacustris]
IACAMDGMVGCGTGVEAGCPPSPLNPGCRKSLMQGRFSGRLACKADEQRLVEECRLLGPLLGGQGSGGERSLTSLASIVRAISSGSVRRHCQQRELLVQPVPMAVPAARWRSYSSSWTQCRPRSCC